MSNILSTIILLFVLFTKSGKDTFQNSSRRVSFQDKLKRDTLFTGNLLWNNCDLDSLNNIEFNKLAKKINEVKYDSCLVITVEYRLRSESFTCAAKKSQQVKEKLLDCGANVSKVSIKSKTILKKKKLATKTIIVCYR